MAHGGPEPTYFTSISVQPIDMSHEFQRHTNNSITDAPSITQNRFQPQPKKAKKSISRDLTQSLETIDMGRDLNDISNHIPPPTSSNQGAPTWKSQNNPLLPQTKLGPLNENINSRDTLYSLIKDRGPLGAPQNRNVKSQQNPPIEGNTIQIFNEGK